MSGEPGALRITLDDDTTVEADTLLVAVGRVPNGDRMDLDVAGIEVDDAGRIVVDAHQRTTADGVWALGDVCTPVPLKHVANREADVVRHNLRYPDDLVERRARPRPVGDLHPPRDRGDRRDRAGPARPGCRSTASGWPATGTPPTDGRWRTRPDSARCSSTRPIRAILGAHIMGPQAPTLVQPLVLAVTLGITAKTMVERPYWIHPALTEVVQQALIAAL